MPIYEYECSNCGKRFEKLQSMTADSLTVCIHCEGGPIRRVMHPSGIIFKGSGWYKTDSRKSGGSDSSSSGSSEKEDKSGSGEKGDAGTSAKSGEGGKSESSSGKDSSSSSE